jgi:hypothetical protein
MNDTVKIRSFRSGLKPMVGFGDPVFAPNQSAAAAGQRTATVKIAATTRAYSDYWHGASVDRARLAEALSPLPDSAEELKAVAAKLGASSSDIYLGRNATEENVKRLPLSDYRVVYFATHGSGAQREILMQGYSPRASLLAQELYRNGRSNLRAKPRARPAAL